MAMDLDLGVAQILGTGTGQVDQMEYIQNQNIQNLRASVILRMVPSSERMALPLLRAVREEWPQLGCGRNSGLNSGIIALP